MKKLNFLKGLFLFVILSNLSCTKMVLISGKVTFWTDYGKSGNQYWYYLNVRRQEGGDVFENQKIMVTSTNVAPDCSSSDGFVMAKLAVGDYFYTVNYGGPTGPNGSITKSFSIKRKECKALTL